jgi:acetyl-CoA carboxylase alpha subunit
MEYLDFELPIKELEDQLDKCLTIGEESGIDISDTCKKIEKKLEITRKEIFNNLTAWQKVQLARHPSRPYTIDYIENITQGTFMELHGDRNVGDDKAMIGGLGKIGDQSFMIIGQQKGYNTKTCTTIACTTDRATAAFFRKLVLNRILQIFHRLWLVPARRVKHGVGQYEWPSKILTTYPVCATL